MNETSLAPASPGGTTARKSRILARWPLLALAAAILLGGAIAGWSASVKEVRILVDGGELEITTAAWRVGGALRSAGVVLGAADAVTPPLDAFLSDGDAITVVRAREVVLHVDQETERLAVAGETVRDVLVAAGVRMGPLDRVEPVRETPIEDGLEIRVIRVTQEEVVERQEIPFRTLEWAEPHLTKGERRLVREGRPGILEVRTLVTYENGEVAHRKVVSRDVVEQAVDQVIGVGTREGVNVLQTASGPLHYTKAIPMVATAYYPGPESTGEWADGYTYTGLRAGKGVVAVDPTVIPLGTRLYIPGYGEAIAADIGGAIKGNRIDLGFATYREAIEYGRRSVTVYVLAPQ